MSQDKETVQLLETSANIRNLYLKQASACNAAFLVKMLEINNQCDLDYKISNNKRLHIEIALMQMCRLASPDGQKPEVNTNYVAAQQTPVKHISSVPVSKPVQNDPPTKVSEPEPEVKTINSVKEDETVIDELQIAAKAAEPEQTYQAPEPEKIDPLPLAPKPEAPKPIPAATSTFSGINFGGLMNPGAVKDKSVEKSETEEEVVLPSDRTPFTQADLESVWMPMAESVSKDMANLYHSLKSRPPVLNDDFKVLVTVDNKIQRNDVFLKQPEILQFLRNELRNWGIQMEIIVADKPQEARRPYTDDDKLAAMIDKNPAIKSLKDQLNLDIDL